MSSKVVVGVLQLNSTPDKEANFAQASSLVHKARQNGAKVSRFLLS
jgi:predicted amidohydrolase